jgi:hypothetical protein
MGLPKKIKKHIPLEFGVSPLERRHQLADMIGEHGTFLPKGLLHADLDKGFLEFVKENFSITIDGKKISMVDILITTQNWSQFTETWDFNDLNGNPNPPFITVVRQPEVKYGSNPALLWNIPNRKEFYYAAVPTWNGNIKGMDIYKIPQPVPVDITYNVKIICNRMRELNEFNKIVIQTFASRQAYRKIEGHYIPIIMGNISDESVVEVEKRRFYIQNYEFTMLGFLLDPDEFEVAPAVSRVFNSFEVVTGNSNRKKKKYPENSATFGYVLEFSSSETSRDIIADYTGNFTLTSNVNIEDVDGYEVYIKPFGSNNFDFYGTDVDKIQVNTNDTLRFVITKITPGNTASLSYQVILEPPAVPYI